MCLPSLILRAERTYFSPRHGARMDRRGNLFIADTLNYRVRRVDARTGRISTVAGDGQNRFAGDGGCAPSLMNHLR